VEKITLLQAFTAYQKCTIAATGISPLKNVHSYLEAHYFFRIPTYVFPHITCSFITEK
jgi:hypothetical protein